jgi:hypothetical protein
MASRTKALKAVRQRKAAPNKVNEKTWIKRVTANVAALRKLASQE